MPEKPKCKLCGGPVKSGNRFNICCQSLLCRRAYARAWEAANNARVAALYGAKATANGRRAT